MFAVPENSGGYTIESINDAATNSNGFIVSHGSLSNYFTAINPMYIIIIAVIIIGVYLYFYRR
jgi:hypothetical protein